MAAMLTLVSRPPATLHAYRQRLPPLDVPTRIGRIRCMCVTRDLATNGPVQTRREVALRHRLTTAACAAADTELHSRRCRTRDIASRCRV